MEINRVTEAIVDEAFKIHSEFGPGLLESVYQRLLVHRLMSRGLRVAHEVPVPIACDGILFDEGFRADLIVEDLVLVELKSTESNHPVHAKQVLTYLRLMDLKLGLLMNFGMGTFKDGVQRLANNYMRSPK